MRKGKSLYTREERQLLAANGFQTALRLLAFRKNINYEDAARIIKDRLQSAAIEIEQYQRTGLPSYLVDAVLEVLAENGVRFGRHQLFPTEHVLAMRFGPRKKPPLPALPARMFNIEL